MYARNLYNKYSDNSVLMASKEELTLMLYEGALKFANQSIIAMEQKDISKANNLVIRVQDIIIEFRNTLDKKYEISEQLDLMYDYMYRRSIEANMQKNPEIMGEVRDLIREMRDTWKEAMKLAR